MVGYTVYPTIGISAGNIPLRPGGRWCDEEAAAVETLDLTEEQIQGRACRRCTSTVPPLHPDETITTRVSVGVVRDTTSVLCTPCLVAAR